MQKNIKFRWKKYFLFRKYDLLRCLRNEDAFIEMVKSQNCHYNGVILKYTCFHFIKFHVSTPYKSHSERNAKFLLKEKLEASCFQFLKKAIENKWIYNNVIFCYTHCIHRNCHLKFLLVYRNASYSMKINLYIGIISMWLERHRIQYFYIRWLYIIFIKRHLKQQPQGKIHDKFKSLSISPFVLPRANGDLYLISHKWQLSTKTYKWVHFRLSRKGSYSSLGSTELRFIHFL